MCEGENQIRFQSSLLPNYWSEDKAHEFVINKNINERKKLINTDLLQSMDSNRIFLLSPSNILKVTINKNEFA